MKIISLVFKLDNYNKNPSIPERLDIIEACLSKNLDTNILVCSEAFLARIDNNLHKFTAIDEFKFTLEDMIEDPIDYSDIDYVKLCEQNKIIKFDDCESEVTLKKYLLAISIKYPNTLIIPGSVFIRSFEIKNVTYIIKNGKILKEHMKINAFDGFENIFKLSEVDKFKNFYDIDGKYDKEYQLFLDKIKREKTIKKPYTKYINNLEYEVAISICADVSPIKEKNKDKLSIFLAPSYGLPPPTSQIDIAHITQNIDIYIQPEGLNFETYVIQNPNFLGTFDNNENKLNKFENTIKCFTINVKQDIETGKQDIETGKQDIETGKQNIETVKQDIEKHYKKYLKYKVKYFKLKTKLK